MMDNSVRDAFTILLEIHSERRFITSLIYLKDEKQQKMIRIFMLN